jgi:hypothetical protein
VCRVSISVQVASRVSQLPLRGAAVSNQGQNRPSKHQKVSLTPLLVGFINGIDPLRKFGSQFSMTGLKQPGHSRLPKTLGRGRFGMEPTANWEMSAKCVMRG